MKTKLPLALLALFVLPLLTACPEKTCEQGDACWCDEHPDDSDCTIQPDPVITYNGSTLVNAQVGVPYSTNVATATGAAPISYTLINPLLLPIGLVFNNGSISGTPTAKTSAVSLQVRASSSGFEDVNAYFSLTVTEGVLNYSGKNDLDGSLNRALSISLATATGTNNIAYAKKSGDLPTGVTLSSAGLLSGTPTVTGTFNFTVTASANEYGSVDANFVLTITSIPTIRYTGSTTLTALIGKSLSIDIGTATGATGAITYAKKSGTLPTGVTLSSAGLLSGTPTNTGPFNFVVTASCTGCTSADASFTLTINNLPVISYSGNTTLTGTINQPVSIDLGTATGATGEITYTKKSGDLPTGLTLSSAGLLSGTPTATGQKTFVVTASCPDCTAADASFTINIEQPSISYVGTTLTAGRVSEGYVAFVNTVTGITDAQKRLAKYTVGAGTNLPAGLVLELNGIIHGVPTAAATTTFKVLVTVDGFGSGEASYTVTVNPAITPASGLTLTAAAQTLVPAIIGEAYSQLKVLTSVVNGRNDPKPNPYYKLAASSTMPVGFILLEDGSIVNTYNALPTTIGTFALTVQVMALSVSTINKAVTLEVKAPSLIYNGGTAATATVGTPYSASLANASTPDGTNPTITYTVDPEFASQVPAGLTINSNGTISGTPTKSTKQRLLSVIASATGFTPTIAVFQIRVLDAFTNVSNGILEVEYIDLDNMKGGGYSSAADEERMIMADTGGTFGASNGYYIPFTHGEMAFTYKFKMSAAAPSAKLTLRLATEIGTITVRPVDYGVAVNGSELNYNPFTLVGSGQNQSNFTDVTLSVDANLKAGDNTIVLTIKSNTLKPVSGGQTCGPIIDCIKLTNLGGSVVNWQPYTYNLDWILGLE